MYDYAKGHLIFFIFLFIPFKTHKILKTVIKAQI